MDASRAAVKSLPLQHVGIVPFAAWAALTAWGVWQAYADPLFTRWTAAYVVVVSYFATDYWLWMLHCFLDRVENLQSAIPKIREYAEKFQDHHARPRHVLTENHLGEIDLQLFGFSAIALALGAVFGTSASTKLIVAGLCVWGGIGGANHFWGHAANHGYTMPAFYTLGQRWGLLPTAKHHKKHHTAPFEENWNFLNGLHWIIYEPIYFALKPTINVRSSFYYLFAQFYVLNPLTAQLILFGTGILA